MLETRFDDHLEEATKHGVRFTHGSRIDFCTCNSNAVIGRQVHVLGMDDPAYMEGFDRFWQAVYPTVSHCAGRCILTGTRKKGSMFDQIYMGSLNQENGWKSMSVNWWDIPERDLQWKEDMVKHLGKDWFDKEYETTN